MSCGNTLSHSGVAGLDVAGRPIESKPCRWIVPGRFPPIQLFERVMDPEDLEAIFELDALTNPGLCDEVGDIELMRPKDRVSGSGTTVIMAAFTHPNPNGSQSSVVLAVFSQPRTISQGH